MRTNIENFAELLATYSTEDFGSVDELGVYCAPLGRVMMDDLLNCDLDEEEKQEYVRDQSLVDNLSKWWVFQQHDDGSVHVECFKEEAQYEQYVKTLKRQYYDAEHQE